MELSALIFGIVIGGVFGQLFRLAWGWAVEDAAAKLTAKIEADRDYIRKNSH